MDSMNQNIQCDGKEHSLNSSVLSVDLFGESKELLMNAREDVTTLFREMGEFIINTADEFKSFSSMIMPYVNYFYADDAESVSDCFVNDVVIPSREDMNSAIDTAVNIMQGDENIYNDLAGAIENTRTLKVAVDSIIDIVENIELYFINTLIISIKAGSEGNSLTKISEEMGELSRSATGILDKFKKLMYELDGEYETFKKLRGRLEVIQENYLTQMKIGVKVVFFDIIDSLRILSDEVNDIIRDSDELETSMKSIISILQMEDLFSQNFLKMIYFIEFFVEGSNEFYLKSGYTVNHSGHIRFEEIVSFIFSNRIENVGAEINHLYVEINEYINRIKIISSELLQFDRDKDENETLKEKVNLDNTYEMVEKMRDDFILNIEDIISSKKGIHDLSGNILSIVKEFGVFFEIINKIAKKFNTINMLTRIEVARNTTLRRTIGSTLSEVHRLPLEIKNKIKESIICYRKVIEEMERAIDNYHKKHTEQKTALQDCIREIKKISVKLYESKKYYNDIKNEIENKSNKIIRFIESGRGKQSRLFETAEIVFGIIEKIKDSSYRSELDSNAFVNLYNSELAIMKNYVQKIGNEGDYKMMVLNSLFSDLMDVKNIEGVTFF